jgi:saccharopine dehydrogenase (NAD+, L-lysine forming)
MINCIGIRKETKDPTQRRAPLTPDQVRELIERHGIRVLVQSCTYRIFPDELYHHAGAVITPDLHEANVIFGIKEVAPDYLLDDTAFCYFTHTIKGQAYNMPMLADLLARRDTVLDYEMIRDADGRRLVYFGNFAGYAGMIDSMWALGKRLEWEGIETPFEEIMYASQYASLCEAEQAFREIGERISREGLPESCVPFVTAFTGYGNVSKGAQAIYDMLPCEVVSPDDLHAFMRQGRFSDRKVYKVVFHESHMFRNRFEEGLFNLQEFYNHPDRYSSQFEQYLPYFSMLMNCIYWDQRYPRLVTRQYLRDAYAAAGKPRLRVIGDISCDVEGSIEATVKQTHADNPIYVYEPDTDSIVDGWEGRGPVILAVDQLPTELPKEASTAFGGMLLPFVPQLAAADYKLQLGSLPLSDELKRAIIAHGGRLTPAYAHLQEYLSASSRG